MNIIARIRRIQRKQLLSQVMAITEMELIKKSRWKLMTIQEILMPFISVLMPLFIMNFVFGSYANVGYWNSANYGLFIIMGYQIALLKGIIDTIPSSFYSEKLVRTLPALMIAPIHRFTFIFGIMLSKLILISIPFSAFLIVSILIYPCAFLTLFAALLVYFVISLIFMGIGTALGVFAISNENIWRILETGIYFLFWLSALNYPIEIFPNIIRIFIQLNPLYYYFDLLRFTWIENDLIYTLLNHPLNVSIFLASAILVPLIGIYVFNKVYRKYGIIL